MFPLRSLHIVDRRFRARVLKSQDEFISEIDDGVYRRLIDTGDTLRDSGDCIIPSGSPSPESMWVALIIEKVFPCE